MEHKLLLLMLLSGNLCAGNDSPPTGKYSLECCQPNACDLISEVAAMRERLRSTTEAQSKLEQNLSSVMQKLAAVEANSQFYRSQVEELRREKQKQDEQLKGLKDALSANSSRVAFTATLGATFGPFPQAMTVKYPKVISNIGNCYNPGNGVFTARVRGAYYFRFTMFNNNPDKPYSVVALTKNGENVVMAWDQVGSGDREDSASNAAVLQLEEGDGVSVVLYQGRTLYGDINYHNTFSGFMLFAL